MDDNLTVKFEYTRPSPEGSRYAALIVLQGDPLGTSIPLPRVPLVIGRGSDCDIRLDDNLSSRQHARVESSGADESREFSIVDLGSTNGTFVNGKLVEDPHLLLDGDKIRVGRHVFKFAWLDEYESEFQERVEQMIMRDDLTNLLTQRSFFVELERQVQRRNSAGDTGTLCVLMMDLDHFKSVNDTYGHLVGSQTIKQVGEIIGANMGEGDVAARYGGEEYIAYLQEASLERGVEVAERIRTAIERHAVVVTRKTAEVRLQVTISIGVAMYPDDSDNPLGLIEKADLALYRAKRLGRNRVTAFNVTLDHIDSEGYQRLDFSELVREEPKK